MSTYRSIASAIKGVQSDINKALANEIATDVIELMKEHINTDVYDAYDPSMYVRRFEDGGLLDDSNFEITFDGKKLIVKNITTNDDRYSPDDGADVGRWIIPIIETGEGYTWEGSRIYQAQPFPRPFNENTQNDLTNGKLMEFLRKELPKYGIRII